MIPATISADDRSRATRILLVEDDAAVCYFLERVLRKAGYMVGMAADGLSGLRVFRAQSWDLVITDRAMPQMNGEAFAAEIKREAPTMPVIMITGFPSHVEKPELFDAIFGKPFSIAELLARLSALLPDWDGHTEAKQVAERH